MDYAAREAEIQSKVDRGNFHAAINLAISAMSECRRNEDQPGVDRFLAVIRAIVETMTESFGSPPDAA